MPRKRVTIADVKPVTFRRFHVSEDGEKLIFEVRDEAGNKGHIAVHWLSLGTTVQLIARGAEEAAEERKRVGKSDDFDGAGSLIARLVSGFQVSELPNENLKVLTLQSPPGFRYDFAIPTDTPDQLGRSLPRAIAEELLRDPSESTRERAH